MNDNNIIDIEEVKEKKMEKSFKEKANDFKEEAKAKIKAGYEWAVENKEVVVPCVLFATKLATGYFRNRKIKHERYDRLCRFYDPKRRYTTYTRRPLTNKELLELERRYDAGESYRSILYDMRLAL